MALMEVVQEISKGYKIETSSWGSFFSCVKGKMISLKEYVTNELFSNLFTKICELLGMPIYVHYFYGYIWKINGEILAYNLYEKNYHYEVVAFFILKRMPIEKKLKYDVYVQIEEVVKQVFSEHNFYINNFVHYVDRKFMFLGNSADAQCLLILKKKSLEFYRSKNETLNDSTTRVIPCYSRREHISLSDLSAVKQVLKNCFIFE